MKNLVYIETYQRHGSGMIFPCKDGDENAYLIITNYHVLRDIYEDDKEQTDKIDLELYDNVGRKIEKKFIKSIRLAHGVVYENENDIAALLVILEDIYHLEFEDFICFENPEISDIYTEGYPHILQDDDINRRLRLVGKLEETFPEIEKMGIYKISDNYHWYGEYRDKELFEGLSGGAVFYEKDGKKYLLGMNQSLCNVGEGNNPFKIMYYIRIRQVFEYLRAQGIILFEYSEGKIRLKWLNQDKQTASKQAEDEKSGDQTADILILGGSGAGKSSFIQELMLHGKDVDACGDGQTTRMDTMYHLETHCRRPRIQIKFVTKEQFGENLLRLTKLKRITYTFTKEYGLKQIDLQTDVFGYLKMFLSPLECLERMWHNREGREEDDEEIERICELGRGILCKNDNAEQDEVLELYEAIIDLLNSLIKNNKLTKQKIISVFCEDGLEKQLEIQEEESYTSISKKINTLSDYISSVLDGEIESNNSQNVNIDLFDTINVCKGFYDISEFYFLDDDLQKRIEEIFQEYKSRIEGVPYGDTEKEVITEDNKKSPLKQYYSRIYEEISSKIQMYFKLDGKNLASNIVNIELEDIGEKERDFTRLCLKVVQHKSLTGIVEKVQIYDSISNHYAYMFHEQRIKEIKFVDTCGLDHVERGAGIKRHLDRIFLDYREQKKEFDAIFYLKKLDAGRPTELEKLLPMIYNACPEKPVFCIFTGADIFYAGREEIRADMEWGKPTFEKSRKMEETVLPKNVVYFYEDEKITENMVCTQERRKRIYRVITENVIPFVSCINKYSKEEFIVSNRRGLRKIFETILLDEWNAGYIYTEELEKLMADPLFKEALENDIRKMFLKASLFDWNKRHHMTVNANVKRLLDKKENYSLGYNGVKFDRWDCLLLEGYQEAFLNGKSKTVEFLAINGKGQSQLEGMFAKLRKKIITLDMSCKNVAQGDKTEFRRIFEEMYREDESRGRSPFGTESIPVLQVQTEKREYLLDVCNFRKRLECPGILDKFVNIFVQEIGKYLKEENQNRIQLMLDYKSGFREKVDKVLDEIEDLVGSKNHKEMIEIVDKLIELRGN